MFNFAKQETQGFVVYRSFQKQGDDYQKKFTEAGTTPQNQATWNIYVQGSFQFSCQGFSQTLTAGQTSLDLNILEFPQNGTCTETVTSTIGVRYCVSSAEGKPWSRRIVELQADQEFTANGKSLVVVLSGVVSLLGVLAGPGAILQAGQGQSFKATGQARVAIATHE